MKYYVVLQPNTAMIYEDWNICKQILKNIPFALFQSFTNLSDAKKYIDIHHTLITPYDNNLIQSKLKDFFHF